MFMFGLQLHAKTEMLPEVSVNESILGGHVVLINMKDSLLISGQETQHIESEIGSEQKDNLLRSFLMLEDASELENNYIGSSEDKNVTRLIIQRYQLIREKQKELKILN